MELCKPLQSCRVLGETLKLSAAACHCKVLSYLLLFGRLCARPPAADDQMGAVLVQLPRLAGPVSLDGPDHLNLGGRGAPRHADNQACEGSQQVFRLWGLQDVWSQIARVQESGGGM